MSAGLAGLAGDLRLRLQLLAMVLLGLALLRPTVPLTTEFFRAMLVFDLTQSMNVADAPAQQARLEFAKSASLEALGDLPCGNEIGLGIFTGHRTFVLFAPVEVCAHHREIAKVVEGLDWRMGWEAKSEVAKGVHSALLVAADIAAPTTVVFLTDGHEAPPISEAFRPSFEGRPGEVEGALVGVGSQGLSPIPKLDTAGRQFGYWEHEDVLQVDPHSLGRTTSLSQEQMAGVERSDLVARIVQGREHLSSLREAYLERLASELRLHYRRLEGPADLSFVLRHPDMALERVGREDVSWLPGLMALSILVYLQVMPGGRGSARAPNDEGVDAPPPLGSFEAPASGSGHTS